MNSRPRWQTTIDALSTVGTLGVCLLLAWRLFATPAARNFVEPPVPADPQPIEGSHPLGSGAAKVVMVEYSDFECPFCAQFESSILPALIREYVNPGKAQLTFRELPLESLHPDALRAAEIAECAGQQNKFWEMHHALFENRERLKTIDLSGLAETLGLDYDAIHACLDGPVRTKVRDDQARAKELGATSTPTMFLGLRQSDDRVRLVARVSGAKPLSEFERALDQLLAK